MNKLILTALTATLALSAQTYQIDSSHSAANFSVKHMMVTNVSGKFANVKGSVNYDEKNLSKSSLDAEIDVATVNTNEAKRDNHLKTPDFFDAGKYPTMNFKSKKFYKTGNVVKIDGDLTMHGVTKAVTLTVNEISPEVKSPTGTQIRGAVAQTKLSRKEFGLTWNKTIESGRFVVGDEVNVTLEIELTRTPNKATS